MGTSGSPWWEVITYCKSSLLLLTWVMDPRVFVWYSVLYVLLFLFVPEPVYDGPSAVENLHPVHFKARVKDAADVKEAKSAQGGGKAPETSEDHAATWLVMYHAGWASASVHLEPTFAELSNQFGQTPVEPGRFCPQRHPTRSGIL